MSIRIRYSCPHCNRRILHHPQLAGHLVICSACKGEFYEPTGIAVDRQGLRYALIVHSSFRLRDSSLTGYLVIVLGVGSIEMLIRALESMDGEQR